jgi:hypothetical protein
MIYSGWFYVMRCKKHRKHIYKFGYTNEIDITMRALKLTRSTASPYEFRIVMAVWTKDARGFEQNEIFKLFSSLRLQKKDTGSSKEPEFFRIKKGSFEWKALESKLDQEIRHGGIKWSKSHGKYHSTDLFGPFKQTIENKKIIQDDEALAEMEQTQTQEEEEPQTVTGTTETQQGELLEALEINTSSESDDSHDATKETKKQKVKKPRAPIRRIMQKFRVRAANVKYYLNKLDDGAIVTTPERLSWSTDPSLNGKVCSMKARYNARTGVLEDLDSHQTFRSIPEFGNEFVRRLGWRDAVGKVFKRSARKAAVEYKNENIDWKTMYLLEGTKRTSLKYVLVKQP